ncbi:sensor histidine kinase [Proteiniborus sp. MB09-C3]|uniref:sensor histidine kinase n=1 Tax=Proteiniborus sp. MB09-C3 TaxID=3050072 RepID=UPI0025579FFE|nr:sensor histidine kinase [Proteiniborus sp. MB09-C3]WIV12701.1 sensor histidine kinase [Proteiniborus sp. MB09-C3]
MNFKKYIKDRISYIVAFFTNTLLIILVMYLTLIINQKKFPKENVIYSFLISFVLFLFFMGYDYLKNRPFYKYLNKAADSTDKLDSILSLTEARTYEQLMYNKILHETYKSYGDKLSKYEENQRQYIYFINQWVHQMKTPVSVINLLLQDKNKENYRETLDSISEENEKITHGLEMMLCNARLSQFNLDFKVEKVDILSTIRKVINDNKKSLIRHSIYPKIVCEENITVETDNKWISFVINQILVNAIKYSKDVSDKDKHITFEIKDEGSRTILSIEDQGIGIPKEDRSRVFNAFFTGINGRKTSESTGMGMYLSKRICDELGHGLTLESEEGKGTKFFIIFYKGKNIFNLTIM